MATTTSNSQRVGLFIFRRDLRLQDNRGLNDAVAQCAAVVPVFIFTPEQVSPAASSYRSENAIRFMIECLEDLDARIAGGGLHLHYGKNEAVVDHLIRQYGITDVYFNKDVTPYAMKRDAAIEAVCKRANVECHMCDSDYYLLPPGSVVSPGSKSVYEKFTPYYNQVLMHHQGDIPHPHTPSATTLATKFVSTQRSRSRGGGVGGIGGGGETRIDIPTARRMFLSQSQASQAHAHALAEPIKGGRAEGVRRISRAFLTKYNKYHTTKNMLDTPTTRLSAYLKFGCISVREAFYAMKAVLGAHSDLIRQLVWRDFYANILFAHPHVLGRAMKASYNRIRWHKSPRLLEAWKNARTGFPIVDAAMTELNTSGFMHNRARLIVASFLVKTLLIDWREGERYFAQKLIDYDPASNNGNWQWIAGSGADSQPYFRIFNPWSQSETYDPDAAYIKKWLPHASAIPPKLLHHWYDDDAVSSSGIGSDVIAKMGRPIVDYSAQKEVVLEMYKRAFSS